MKPVEKSSVDKMAGRYDNKELRVEAVRVGAMDAYHLPSRFNNEIIYRDGKKETTDHGKEKIS